MVQSRCPGLLASVLVVGVFCVVAAGCGGSLSSPTPPAPTDDRVLDRDLAAAFEAASRQRDPGHKLMMIAEIPNLRDASKFTLMRDHFDAVLYGHPGSAEDLVAELRSAGVEVWRYYNVFSVSLRSPEWGGYYGALWDRLQSIHGFIPGARYRWFASDLGPSPIMDHTRHRVTEVLDQTISEWTSDYGSDHVLLDVTFEGLEDWMLWPGDQWPWSDAQRVVRNRAWRSNMEWLIEQQGAQADVAINGSYVLDAPVVMYEAQPWNHRRGRQTWTQLFERVHSEDVVPILHAGHLHLPTPAERLSGETATLAAWLLLDEAYLAMEPDLYQMQWLFKIASLGLLGFEASAPAREIEPNVWTRDGIAGGVRWQVTLDTQSGEGSVVRILTGGNMPGDAGEPTLGAPTLTPGG